MTNLKKDNQYLADKLYEYADWLEATGDNPYKCRAYRRAARVLQHQQEDVHALIEQGFDLTKWPHIGKGIAYTIQVLLNTGAFPESKQSGAKKKVNGLLNIKGLGPKRIKWLHEKYNIHTKHALLKALRTHQFEASEMQWLNQLKKEIRKPKKPRNFLRLYHGLTIVDTLLAKLIKLPDVQSVYCCGDYRRKQEIIEYLVLIIQSSNLANVFQYLTTLPYVKDLLYKRKNYLKVRLSTGIDLDIYGVEKESLGASLIFYTGSHEHVLQLTQYAKHKGLILNQQGLFKEEQKIAGSDEGKIYEHLGLTFIEPELREGRGEIAAAATHQLPNLIKLEDIKGDLHSHTNETDGQETLETMVNAAFEQGYEYVAITDHSKSLTITHGLDEKRLLKQIKLIDKLNERYGKILILKSIEVDILEDGSLDLSNDVLKELDIVVCSVHSKFKLEEAKQTERILRAMENPYFNILGHATGRLIKSRPPYAIDLARILQKAKERNCFIELNAQPYRLDINDFYCKKAKEMGIKVAISSDAHTIRGFNFMQLGIYQARRGWLEKSDVINTRNWPDLKKLLTKP